MSVEENMELIMQMNTEQRAKAVSVLKALVIKDYDKVERLYKEYFSPGEMLDRLLADVAMWRARHA